MYVEKKSTVVQKMVVLSFVSAGKTSQIGSITCSLQLRWSLSIEKQRIKRTVVSGTGSGFYGQFFKAPSADLNFKSLFAFLISIIIEIIS